MYTLVSHVPFRRVNERVCEVASDWARSLLLLRDSFAGRFGQIVVAAPAVPAGDGAVAQQCPAALDETRDDIRFVALGDARWQARQFWRHYRRIRGTCEELARRSDVVHAGINNLYQPYSFIGFNAGRRMGATTVFVQDGDAILRLHDLARGAAALGRLRTAAYCKLYERLTRRAVAQADLCLLKGRAVNERYGRYARNAHDFYDTSHSAADVASPADVERKCSAILKGEPLRCLSLGRLIAAKHVDHSIQAVAQAAGRGVPVTLDIIGDGPDGDALRQLVRSLGAERWVRFLGSRSYGPALLHEAAGYHVFLFTSLADETPRALFDGMAGGCALLAYDLPFTRQVLEECRHGRCVANGDAAALAAALMDLHRDRPGLTQWMRSAAAAGLQHAAERWYERRAAWTIEAFERRRGAAGAPAVAQERPCP